MSSDHEIATQGQRALRVDMAADDNLLARIREAHAAGWVPDVLVGDVIWVNIFYYCSDTIG